MTAPAPQSQPRIATWVEQTYLALLLMPHNSLRHRLQTELASCRNALALSEECDPEDIQTRFECHAERLIPLLWEGPAEIASLRSKVSELTAILQQSKAAMLRTRTASIVGSKEDYAKPEKWAEELYCSHGDLTASIRAINTALAVNSQHSDGEAGR